MHKIKYLYMELKSIVANIDFPGSFLDMGTHSLSIIKKMKEMEDKIRKVL